MAKKIVVVGGAGDMARVTVRKLLGLSDSHHMVLADLDAEKAERVAGSFGSNRVEWAGVDIFARDDLRGLIRGADMVLNATGPLYRTGVPVLEACIAEKVHYIDYGDTYEAAEAMFERDAEAQEAGITALLCAGLTPGLLGLLGKKCMASLDEVDTLEFAFVSGSNSPTDEVEKGGTAIVDHMLFETTGTCVVLEGGERIEVPAFRKAVPLDFPEPLGRYTCYLIGHAEVSTFPRFFPGLRDVRVYGGMHPPYLVGLFQGLADRLDAGTLTHEQARDFLSAIDAGRRPTDPALYRAVLRGILGQLRRGEMGVRDLLGFLHTAVTCRLPSETMGALKVSVEGTLEGRRVRAEMVHATRQGPGTNANMDDTTGTPMAAFIQLFLDGGIDRKGVVSPEACVDPDAYLAILAKLDMLGIEIMRGEPHISTIAA
ncbi:MAG: saccharopine dehydrogenase NADP-binding domain-containing protein [Deltaproteobacteria bacterium]|nr:saccharopine dehydrogenase NADP-binding domain-containing protein [Deltaproteobacteria bacterium]